MRVQDYVADQTEWAVGNFYRNVRRVPEEHLNWQVLDQGRSVLDQVQECAMSPRWPRGLIEGTGGPDWSPEGMAAAQEEMSAWTTIDQCEEEHYRNLSALMKSIRETSDARAMEKIEVPFAPEPLPVSSVFMFHYWNVAYHLGQILYIQTLYGDKEMVF